MEDVSLISDLLNSGFTAVLLFLYMRERARSAALSDSRVELLKECYGDLIRESIVRPSKNSNPPALS